MKSYCERPIGSHQRSFERYHPRPPIASPSTKILVRNPHPKLQSLLSQERVKLRTSNLAGTFTGPSEQKPSNSFGERERGRIQGSPIFSGMVKATNFKFCALIHTIDRNKRPLKISGKVAVCVLRDSREFSGHPYMGRIARLSLR